MKVALALSALLTATLLGLPLLALLLSAGAGTSSCTTADVTQASSPTAGGWVATAYGPPWGGIQGDGTTATGLNLTSGPPAYEIAVNPVLIPLGSYVHIQPNPFNTTSAFYAGDTGAAITGQHIDIYDWQGRENQNAWGARNVSVTPAPAPSGQSLLDGLAPTPATETTGATEACSQPIGEHARILPDGDAVAPPEAPAAVRLAIAAGNLIQTLPYPEPDVHYGSLAKLWPAYDCSGATSFLLYAAHLLSPTPLDSSELENYGQPGPGHWITIYANPTHTWIVIAGIALDTANYGGPPIPEGTGPRWRSEPLANLNDGTRYVSRHPPGL
jgi:3D (Asp-Asp-Asp) domain-containing protein